MESRVPAVEETELAKRLELKEDAAYKKAIAKHPEDAKEIARQRAVSNPPTFIDTFEVRGPYHALKPLCRKATGASSFAGMPLGTTPPRACVST